MVNIKFRQLEYSISVPTNVVQDQVESFRVLQGRSSEWENQFTFRNEK